MSEVLLSIIFYSRSFLPALIKLTANFLKSSSRSTYMTGLLSELKSKKSKSAIMICGNEAKNSWISITN